MPYPAVGVSRCELLLLKMGNNAADQLDRAYTKRKLRSRANCRCAIAAPYIPYVTRLTRWWGLGRLCLPKIFFFVAHYGGSAAVVSHKKAAWRACSPPNLPAMDDRVSRVMLQD